MADDRRSIAISRVSKGTYQASNPRGGTLVFGSGDSPEFTPVELLLVAIGGCTAVDVDFITVKRAEPDSFEVTVAADKVRDEAGNRLEGIEVRFRLAFPEGEAGDAARAALPVAIERSHQRLCTVSRTVELGTPVDSREA